MVQRIIRAVYREVRGLHEAAYVLALFTFGSQLLALFRDRLLANQFGAGIELDVYYAAFRVPDLLYVLFASTLSVYVLIPFVVRRLENGGNEEAKKILSQVFTLFLGVYSVLALVLILFASDIAPLLFPGFSESELSELVLLLRILLLQPLFLGLSSLFGVITQVNRRFVLYALSPILYNVGIIIGIVFFYPIFGLSGLALGVILGAVFHMSVQLPFVKGSGMAPTLLKEFDFKALREVLRISIPRALTLSLHQIVFLALVGIASVMAVGSVSVFQFAYNLQSVPLAIIGVSYSVATFPALAKFFSKGEHVLFISHVTTAIKHILFWAIPVTALIIVIRAQLVRVVLGTGAFDWDDTILTAAALALFAVSLSAQALSLLLVRAFYAGGNTRVPLIVTLVSSIGGLLLTFILYILYLNSSAFALGFSNLMRAGNVVGAEVLTLAFGYTITLILHTLALFFIFHYMYRLNLKEIWGSLFRSLFAAFVGGITAYAVLNLLVDGVQQNTFLGVFLQGLIAGVVGILVIGYTLHLIRSPEFKEVLGAFHRRIFKTDVVAPQNIDNIAM